MNKEFVPHTEAFELKEIGFDEPCFGRLYYPMLRPNSDEKELFYESGQFLRQTEETTLLPTYSQCFRWFRKKHQIVCVIDFYNDGDLWEDTMYTVTISEFKHFKSHDSFVQFEYKTYEEAELACLRKLIEIVKNK